MEFARKRQPQHTAGRHLRAPVGRGAWLLELEARSDRLLVLRVSVRLQAPVLRPPNEPAELWFGRAWNRPLV